MPATGDRITKRKDGLFQGMYTTQTPNWDCPASTDGFILSHGDTSQSSLLVLNRAQMPQRGVPPFWIVEALDVLEDPHPHTLPARPRVSVQEFALQSGNEAL